MYCRKLRDTKWCCGRITNVLHKCWNCNLLSGEWIGARERERERMGSGWFINIVLPWKYVQRKQVKMCFFFSVNSECVCVCARKMINFYSSLIECSFPFCLKTSVVTSMDNLNNLWYWRMQKRRKRQIKKNVFLILTQRIEKHSDSEHRRGSHTIYIYFVYFVRIHRK